MDDDAPLGGDGATWSTAYRFLQDALAVAATGDEIRVAGGTYTPDRDEAGNVTPGDRTETFRLVDGIGMYGGYAGLADPGNPNERDIALYETVLSGDLNGDDDGGDGTGENSYQVARVNADAGETTVLDGVTITAANGGDESTGGGMFIPTGSPRLTDCTFRQNTAHHGGGLFNVGSPTLVGCVFDHNTVTASGGGMYDFGEGVPTALPTLLDCTFSENWAENNGGGMRNWDCSATLTDCAFIGNHVRYSGAGIANGGASDSILTNCTFVDNRTDTLFAPWDSYGGGMTSSEESRPTLINCTFLANSAHSLYPNLSRGGALATHGTSDPTLINCTFEANYANIGDGIYGNDDSSPTLANCILRDGGDEVRLDDSATIAITYSNVEGGWPGQGNLSADPLLDDLRLSPGSPCIDAGDNTVVTEGTDLDGHPRIADDPNTPDTGNPPGAVAIVDMGAYEFQPAIPAVREWGLGIMTLLVLTGGTVIFAPKRQKALRGWQ